MSLSVKPEDGEAVLFGKAVNELQSDMVADDEVTGTLKYVNGYVDFSSNTSEQSGNYLALKIEAEPAEAETVVELVGGTKGPVALDDDMNIVLLIKNKDKEELFDLLDHIHQIAEEYGIHINKKKTRIVKISSTYKFLQIKYSLTDSGKVIKRINPKRVTTMRRKLKKLAVKVKNEEITYENVENMFRGWMGSFYKLLSKEQRKNLIGLYEDLFEKSITIISKRMIITDKIK